MSSFFSASGACKLNNSSRSVQARMLSVDGMVMEQESSTMTSLTMRIGAMQAFP